MKPLKILLFEDNELNQKFANAVIKRLGHTVDIANNGIVGIQKYQESEYDLILMDIQMPDMNGIEATRAIRKLEENTGKHIPIIAITAFALEHDKRNCFEAGMDEFLPKPFLLADLDNKIKLFFP